MTIYAPPENKPEFDPMERISISYVGHGEKFEASIQSDNLTADSAYDWLLRALRAIQFEALADLIESDESKVEK